MVSTDNTVKLAPGVTSVVKLAEGPVQEMVGTGLPCAVQLNVAWCDWFTVRSTGGPRKKGWTGWMGVGDEVADSESERYTECGWEGMSGCHTNCLLIAAGVQCA